MEIVEYLAIIAAALRNRLLLTKYEEQFILDQAQRFIEHEDTLDAVPMSVRQQQLFRDVKDKLEDSNIVVFADIEDNA